MNKHVKRIIMLIITASLIFLAGCALKDSTEYPIKPGNEAFYLENNNSDVAVLLVHGFAASPEQMRELGDYLFERGFTVHGVRLAGHGTSEEDLKEMSWEDWYSSVVEAHQSLKSEKSKVYVVGLSLGSVLTLQMTKNQEIDGAVLISTILSFKDTRAQKSGILKYFAEYYEQRSVDENKSLYYYRKRPVAALAELVSLVDTVKADLTLVNEPLLIIHSEKDRTADLSGSQLIYDSVSSDDKQLLIIEEGGHVLTESESKEEVFEAIYDFILKHST